MEKLKNALVGTLGVVGYVVWNVILFGVYFIPVTVLDFPLWADILICLCIMEIPIVGRLMYFAAWIWSFIIVISNPIGGFSIFYLIAFAIYVLTGVVPFIINLVSVLFDERE